MGVACGSDLDTSALVSSAVIGFSWNASDFVVDGFAAREELKSQSTISEGSHAWGCCPFAFASVAVVVVVYALFKAAGCFEASVSSNLLLLVHDL